MLVILTMFSFFDGVSDIPPPPPTQGTRTSGFGFGFGLNAQRSAANE